MASWRKQSVCLSSFSGEGFGIGDGGNGQADALMYGRVRNRFAAAKTHMKTTQLGSLWLRVTAATVIDLGVDTFVFSGLAFAGAVPVSALWSIILVSWALKAVYVLIATPITLALIVHLKRVDSQFAQGSSEQSPRLPDGSVSPNKAPST